MVTAFLGGIWDWLKDIPHIEHRILDTVCIEDVQILCPINNVEKIVLIIAILVCSLPALALKYFSEVNIAHVVYQALDVALQIEFIFQRGLLPRIISDLRVNEAPMEQLEEDSKKLGRVSHPI